MQHFRGQELINLALVSHSNYEHCSEYSANSLSTVYRHPFPSLHVSTLSFSHCSSLALMCVAVSICESQPSTAARCWQSVSYWKRKLMNLFQCFHPLTKR